MKGHFGSAARKGAGKLLRGGGMPVARAMMPRLSVNMGQLGMIGSNAMSLGAPRTNGLGAIDTDPVLQAAALKRLGIGKGK